MQSRSLPTFFVAAMAFLFHLLFLGGREGRGGGGLTIYLPIILNASRDSI